MPKQYHSYWQLYKAAGMLCKRYRKGNPELEVGNKLANYEAKQAAEGTEILSLIPDTKIQVLNSGFRPNYSTEGKKSIGGLGGKERTASLRVSCFLQCYAQSL